MNEKEFNKLLKTVCKMYVKETTEELNGLELKRLPKLSLKFRFRMWWMFRKAVLKEMFYSI